MTTFAQPGAKPRIGSASGAHGRMHAWLLAGRLSPTLEMDANARDAASTRARSGWIFSGASQSPPSSSRSADT